MIGIKLRFLAFAIVAFQAINDVRAAQPLSWAAVSDRPSVYSAGWYRDDNEIWVVNPKESGVQVMRTNDGGRSWNVLVPPQVPIWRPRLFVDETGRFVLINGQKSWNSVDGKRWEAFSSDVLRPTIRFSSQRAIRSVVDGRIDIFDVDRNNSVREYTEVSDISILNEKAGFVVITSVSPEQPSDVSASMVSIENRGGKWVVSKTEKCCQANEPFIPSLLMAASPALWWAGSDQMGGLYKTTDGGASWKEQILPDERAIAAVFFRNQRLGRALGASRGLFYETTDGGATWTPMREEDVKNSKFMEFFSGHKLYEFNAFAVAYVLSK